MRTGTNIVQRGLDEFFYSVKIGKGKVVNPLRKRGLLDYLVWELQQVYYHAAWYQQLQQHMT